MSTEFKREERYSVFKLSDVEEHFTPGERQQLARLAEVQRVGRSEAGKPPLECVVVEADWPEYEPTWKAIEARMTDAQPAPSEKDEPIHKAWARFSNELHRSPDTPYPGMSEAFEQHFSQSFTDREWRSESGTWAAAWKAAKRHEAQAQPAPSVPEGWKLVPIEPTPGMIDAAEYVDWGDADVRGSCINAWDRMLAAAPETKP
jgi:hypothetical protein